MQLLEVDSITYFIGKIVNLLHESRGIREAIEVKLTYVNTFSEEELAGMGISNADIVRYLLLKELIEHNQSFRYGVQDSHRRGEVRVSQGGDALRLDIAAYRPDEARILEFLSKAYNFSAPPKETWLIGQRAKNEGWRADPEERYDFPFDTRKTITDVGLTDLVLVGPDAKGPRCSYDGDIYQRFRSPKGFGPVADFCSRFPHQFFQAIVVVPGGELYLEPQRRHRGRKVTHYSAQVSLISSTGDEFTEIGKMADEYLTAVL